MEANLNPSSIHLSTYSIHDNNIKKVNVQIVQYNIVCIDASEINFYLFYSVTCCADSWILFLAVVKLVGWLVPVMFGSMWLQQYYTSDTGNSKILRGMKKWGYGNQPLENIDFGPFVYCLWTILLFFLIFLYYVFPQNFRGKMSPSSQVCRALQLSIWPWSWSDHPSGSRSPRLSLSLYTLSKCLA